jgi:hypothetical protein
MIAGSNAHLQRERFFRANEKVTVESSFRAQIFNRCLACYLLYLEPWVSISFLLEFFESLLARFILYFSTAVKLP